MSEEARRGSWIACWNWDITGSLCSTFEVAALIKVRARLPYDAPLDRSWTKHANGR
jgi:hypothetical protein